MTARYMRHDSSKLEIESDHHEELVLCLNKIIQGYPPSNKYPKHELRGLYAGPTSIAYLFLQLAITHPDLVVAGHHARSWAVAYTAGERPPGSADADHCGVINEELAHSAVSAALNGEAANRYIHSLAAHAHELAKAPGGSDEWLYGRAGLLYLLRLVRHWVPSSIDMMNACIKEVCGRILQNGPPWTWHGKEYLGAVHGGTIGIITQLILADPKYATHPKVKSTLNDLLAITLQTDGNFPSSANSGHDHLVQFCHGAPGLVLSLGPIRPHVDASVQKSIDEAMSRARKRIFERGLLTKEPNLCHGASANALALDTPGREHLMAYTTAGMIARGKKEGWYIPGDDQCGLFCGEAGRAWAWAVLDSGKEMGIIGYSDL